MDIAEIDPNFKPAEIGGRAVCFTDALSGGPFRLTGFPWRGADLPLRRLPETLSLHEVNEGALFLSLHTSGGQLAFKTDSRVVAVRAVLNVAPHDMNHMPRLGSSGFDLQRKTGNGQIFVREFAPHVEHLHGEPFAELATVGETREMRSFRLYFPLYGGVRKLEIGVEPGAALEAPEPFAVKKPILLYGGSIFQGGCASRPGNSFGNLLCRKLDAPGIDLGFSGCGLGEIAIARKIAELDLAALLMGCELNAPTAEFLRERLNPFFDTVRAAHPELPIVFVTQGDYTSPDRAAVVRGVCERAWQAGDRHTHLVTRKECFAELDDWQTATVDGCHPNDLGFYLMYRAILPVLQAELGL